MRPPLTDGAATQRESRRLDGRRPAARRLRLLAPDARRPADAARRVQHRQRVVRVLARRDPAPPERAALHPEDERPVRRLRLDPERERRYRARVRGPAGGRGIGRGGARRGRQHRPPRGRARRPGPGADAEHPDPDEPGLGLLALPGWFWVEGTTTGPSAPRARWRSRRPSGRRCRSPSSRRVTPAGAGAPSRSTCGSRWPAMSGASATARRPGDALARPVLPGQVRPPAHLRVLVAGA